MQKIKNFLRKFLQGIRNYFRKLFTEEYQVVIWYVPENKTVYHFKKIIKLTDTQISGVKTTGEKFDMKVKEPFNYQITKLF